jgi:hypothetical protein
LEGLLNELRGRAIHRVDFLSRLADSQEGHREAAALKRRALGSAAWHGGLDKPHPFQVHVFDLDALRGGQDGNAAVRRLYEWATAEIGGAGAGGVLDYDLFLADVASSADIERMSRSAAQLSRTVVGLLQKRYLERLRAANLFELLAHGLGSAAAVDQALNELIRRLDTLKTRLVPFDERLGGRETVKALREETFLSCHVRDDEEERLKQIAAQAGILTTGADNFRRSLDPHRLQMSYMHHALSLGTIHDFFSPADSAMEQYIRYEEDWERSPTASGLPPHSCTALRKLVRDQEIVERLLREDGGGEQAML